jgi:type IV secretory pathway TrbD component
VAAAKTLVWIVANSTVMSIALHDAQIELVYLR